MVKPALTKDKANYMGSQLTIMDLELEWLTYLPADSSTSRVISVQ